MSVILFFFLAPIASFGAMWLFPRVSLGIILRVAVIIQFISSFFRLITFANGECWPIVVGNIGLASTGPIFALSSTIFTTSWFPEKERTLATALISIPGFIGAGLSFGMSQYYLNTDYETIDEVMWNIMLFQNIMYSVVFVIFMALFRSKPEHPPTPAAEAPVFVVNFLEGFKLMWSNKNFGLLSFIFAFKQATLNSYGMMLADIMSPYGHEPVHLAFLGICFLIGGLLGATIFTILADKTKKF